MARKANTAPRRGRVSKTLDWLLVASVAFVAVLAAAYVWMPQFKRGVGTVVDQGAKALGIEE